MIFRGGYRGGAIIALNINDNRWKYSAMFCDFKSAQVHCLAILYGCSDNNSEKIVCNAILN